MLPLPVFKIDLSGLQDFVDELEDIDMSKMTAGAVSEGPAEAYALVWEYGNTRQTKKGPKTVLGVTPDGKHVWLSSQAPNGYIRVNAPKFVEIVEWEVATIDFNAGKIKQQMEAALTRAAVKIAAVIREAAPYDTGDLAYSIRAVGPGEMLVEEDEDDWDI